MPLTATQIRNTKPREKTFKLYDERGLWLGSLPERKKMMQQWADYLSSLERGKDADFVVFDGNPFELTSHVRLVVVSGEIAHDARNGGAK